MLKQKRSSKNLAFLVAAIAFAAPVILIAITELRPLKAADRAPSPLRQTKTAMIDFEIELRNISIKAFKGECGAVSSELNQAEQKFSHEQKQIEELLAQASIESDGQELILSLLDGATRHQKLLADIFAYCAMLGEETSWSNKHSLKVPYNMVEQLPALAVGSQNRLGDVEHLVLTQKLPDGSAELRLSPVYLQSLKLWQRFSRGESREKSFFTMTRYLIARQLQENLVELERLRGHTLEDSLKKIPQIPEPLASELAGIDPNSVLKENLRIRNSEVDYQMVVLEKFRSRIKELPPFFTNKLIMDLSKATIGLDDDAIATAFSSTLGGIIQENATPVKLREAMAKVMGAGHWILTTMEPGARAEALRLIIGRAWTSIALSCFDKLIQSGLAIPKAAKFQIMKALVDREREYVKLLHRDVLATAFDGAEEDAKKQTDDDQITSEFGTAFLAAAERLRDAKNADIGKEPLNFELLTQSMSAEIDRLKPRQDTVQFWLGQLSSASTYAEAKTAYCEVLKTTISKDINCTADTIDFVAAEKALSGKSFSTTGLFSSAASWIDEKASKLLAGVELKDRKDWIAIGKLFGFDKKVSANPTVQEVLAQKYLKLYKAFSDNKIRNQYPLLSLEITYATLRMPVYELLNKYTLPETRAYIMYLALEGLEAKIREDIATAATTKDLRPLEQILRGALLTKVFDGLLPEFKPDLQAELSRFASVGFFKAGLEKIVRPYLNNVGQFYMYSVMLAQGAMFLSKRLLPKYVQVFEPLIWTLEPFIAAHSAIMMPAMFVDFAAQGIDVYHLYKKSKTASNFFLSRAQGLSFLEYHDYESAKATYKSAFQSAVFNLFFTAGLMVPSALASKELKDFDKKLAPAIQDLQIDCKAFKDLGLPLGSWDTRWIRIALKRKLKTATTEEELQRYQGASVWLFHRIKTKSTWDLLRVVNAKPATDEEKLIVKAIDEALKLRRKAEVEASLW